MDARVSDRFAEEQAALRRVALLVARGAPPEEVFAAVTAEIRRLLDADLTTMARYDPGGAITYVAQWRADGEDHVSGTRAHLGGLNLATLVFETCRPARINDFSKATGPASEVGRAQGVRSSGWRSSAAGAVPSPACRDQDGRAAARGTQPRRI
jgi:GAF domain-containing protein